MVRVGLTEREKGYEVSKMKEAIESSKDNIKTFEMAIEREQEQIKRYRQIITELEGG